MNTFLINVLRGTPIWVWAIFITLVTLGVRQLRERRIKPLTILIAPIAFFILGLITSSRSGVVFVMWAIPLLTITWFTASQWRPAKNTRYDASEDRLVIPGSPGPLIIMLTIFAINYAIAVAGAIGTPDAATPLWKGGAAIIMGALSGFFIGRAIAMYRLKSRS